jgi:hypothetical protein
VEASNEEEVSLKKVVEEESFTDDVKFCEKRVELVVGVDEVVVDGEVEVEEVKKEVEEPNPVVAEEIIEVAVVDKSIARTTAICEGSPTHRLC